MSPARPTETLQSLRECAKQLAGEDWLGSRAPAYITLKRWAKQNLLKTARVLKAGVHHPLYRLEEVARIARERHGQAEAKLAPVAARPAQPGAPAARIEGEFPRTAVPAIPQLPLRLLGAEDVGQAAIAGTLALIADTLIEIRNSLAGRSKQEDLLINGLTDLDVTRKLLMNKYDGELTSLQKKVGDVTAENAALKKMHSPIDVAKLNMIMSRVSDQLAGLAR